MAGSALLLAVESSLDSASDSVESVVADGLARQLIDEVLTRRYMAAGASPQQWPMCPNSYEMAGPGRSRYDDIDDYVNFTSCPAADPWTIELGRGNGAGGYRHANFALPAGTFANWRQRVKVSYVNSSDLSSALASGSTSEFRAVEASIYRVQPDGTERLVTTVRRVVSYVPPPL